VVFVMKKMQIAIAQTCSGRDASSNFEQVLKMLDTTGDIDLIALPEVFAMRGTAADYRSSAESLSGPTCSWISKLAKERHAWVLAGSLMENCDGHVYNTSALVDREGNQVATYRKMHLFEVTLEDGTQVRESDFSEAGTEPTMADLEGWSAGMAICYDLRFPELFRHYASSGMQLLFVPSDFTQRTGKDHWEILVRARAIENQCFVVAPNQCGMNAGTGVASYGNSMIVGPWGEILARAGDGPEVITVELDPAALQQTRNRVPALRHRVM